MGPLRPPEILPKRRIFPLKVSFEEKKLCDLQLDTSLDLVVSFVLVFRVLDVFSVWFVRFLPLVTNVHRHTTASSGVKEKGKEPHVETKRFESRATRYESRRHS